MKHAGVNRLAIVLSVCAGMMITVPFVFGWVDGHFADMEPIELFGIICGVLACYTGPFVAVHAIYWVYSGFKKERAN